LRKKKGVLAEKARDLDILQSYKLKNGGWSILFIVIKYIYRDGVSEGQFYQVLLYELDAIRKVLGYIDCSYIYLHFLGR